MPTNLENPYIITTTKTITKFEIKEVTLILNEKANIQVFLMDDTDNLLEIKFITLDGENYANWGQDDTYIYTYVKNLLETNSV